MRRAIRGRLVHSYSLNPLTDLMLSGDFSIFPAQLEAKFGGTNLLQAAEVVAK